MHTTLFPPLPQHEASGPAEPLQQQRLLSSVRQDKSAASRARIPTLQPAAPETGMRTYPLTSNPARSHTKPPPKRRTVPLTLWVQPVVKAELQRKAQLEGLSVSAAGGALLNKALQQHIDLQYGAFLRPVIENEIKKQLQGMSTRLARLLIRVAFDVGQIRSLVTNILGRQPGMNQDELQSIMDGSSKTAKNNIFRRTPQIAALIEAVEQGLQVEESHLSMGNGHSQSQLHEKQQGG
jgi:hypothetical protein